MGLDITHDAFSGSYGGFDSWRVAITESLENGYSPDTNPGLYELLNHSDRDGFISPQMCGVIAAELEFILPLMELKFPSQSPEQLSLERFGMVNLTKQFIKGCHQAASLNESMFFE